VAERPAAGAAGPDRPLDDAPRPASFAAREPLLLSSLRRSAIRRSALATLRYPPRAPPTLDLPLAFSLSHCDGRDRRRGLDRGPVGVDVEKIEPLDAGDFRSTSMPPSAPGPAQRRAASARLDAQGSGREGRRHARPRQPAGGRHERRAEPRASRAALADHAARRRPGHVGHVALPTATTPP
jgi:hypothetical protein